MTKLMGLSISLDDDKMYIDLDKPTDVEIYTAIMKGQLGISPRASKTIYKKFVEWNKELNKIIEED